MKEKKQHTENTNPAEQETEIPVNAKAEEQAENKKQGKKNCEKPQKSDEKKCQGGKTESKKADGEKLEALEKQLAEQKDMYLRLAAEFDNYKKRTKREAEALGAFSRAEVVKGLLPALDNFMRVKSADGNSDEFKKGVELSIKSFTDALEKLGVEEIDCENAVFDPEMHYAVAQIEDENLGENTVAQVMQKGYKIGDKVIRHAMVSVANCK